MTQPVQPSINVTAFSCPHCGAYTTQTWYTMRAAPLTGESRTPGLWDAAGRKDVVDNTSIDKESKALLLSFIDKVLRGQPFLETGDYADVRQTLFNLNLSKCFNCGQLAVWVHDRLLYPPQRAGAAPNPDLPEELARDFEEARSIVDLSPRGAAALLRLVIQKLCVELGEPGKNINDDIASLVAKGLDPLVQQALDVVRVIGNDAVHPGELDIRDDRETALRLFELVNAIVARMISHPKSVKALYGMLPEKKREAIDQRNENARKTD